MPMLVVLPQVLIVPSIFCAAKPPPLAKMRTKPVPVGEPVAVALKEPPLAVLPQTTILPSFLMAANAVRVAEIIW